MKKIKELIELSKEDFEKKHELSEVLTYYDYLDILLEIKYPTKRKRINIKEYKKLIKDENK